MFTQRRVLRASALLVLLVFRSLSYAQVYSGGGGLIPDNGTPTDFSITVSGLIPDSITPFHGLRSVCLDITHSYCGDLVAHLIAPDGTTVILFEHVGGGGQNFTNTCLEDSALVNIGSAVAPFTGLFHPQDLLGNVNNAQDGNGTWTLRMTDPWPVDQGTLNSWSLTFTDSVTGPLAIDSTNLPIVIIDSDSNEIVENVKVHATMRIIDNGPGAWNHPDDPPTDYDGDIGIEIRGAYSAILPQKPYNIETRDSLGENLNVPLLGMPQENDWILLANYNDKIFMRNTLPFALHRQMGHYSPRTREVEVMINDVYQGIYIFTEKIKRDSHRVDIAKLRPDELAGDSVTGGYILKHDYVDWFDSWLSDFHPLDHPTYDVYYLYHTPAWDEIAPQQQTYIQGFIHQLEAALYAPDFADPATGYRQYLDVVSFMDYFFLSELSRNNDGFKKSMFMYKDKDSNGGLLHYGPIWDFDWAWKNIAGCPIFSATDGSGWAHQINDCDPDVRSSAWFLRLEQDSVFTRDLRCRWDSLRTTALDTANIFHFIDSVYDEVLYAQQRHYAKWPILGLYTGTPEVDPPCMTFAEERTRFKDWISLRLAWLDANMPGECTGSVGMEAAESRPPLRVFPNPGNDRVFVESGRAIAELVVHDGTGRAILRAEGNGRYSLPLDVSRLSNGLYRIEVLGVEELSGSIQLIVQH